ncbi:4Fe-4S single cluster domain-containing protein [Chitinophaga sp. S165]|uniref:4Fe-4S single cluster domain-containing protein n=1 Tax=Chitinophaga sp. S165 TaxID=2135462 RepID=UPI000D8AC898|nr:4Fe-4S single cluster domain-containing protein [Chitinophaga sp. S165]PWV45828.1 anaerobic ribonucleoside-triphosphate reductase activating protein [Chitinophaga sp. S165]
MHMTPSRLNIAQLCPATKTLGPGERFAIWVQGCPFNCKGCISPDWIPFKIATPMPIDLLAKQIIAEQNIEGITISGGEPMMQAGKLSGLIRRISAERPELNVIVFTGFTHRQLVWDEARELLACIDLLVDGQYVQHLNDQTGLRGSANQQFHFLTDRLLPFREQILNRRSDIEIHLLNDGALMAGIPPSGFNW